MSFSVWVVILLVAAGASAVLGARVGRLQANERRARRSAAADDSGQIGGVRRAQARDAMGAHLVTGAFTIFAAAVAAAISPMSKLLLAVIVGVSLVSTTIALALAARHRP